MTTADRDRASARDHALAVLRIRGAVFAVALLPAAVAVVLWTGSATGRFDAAWDGPRWAVTALAVLVLGVTAVLTALVATARPSVPPSVPLAEQDAPDLYRMIRDLADRLDVPEPSAIALTPDCDSWLEDEGARTPTLVIGSPFLWWMRVAELRALLAPVVAGTGPAVHPDIAAARRIVRALDAASRRPSVRVPARLLLRPTGPHAAEMERLVATACSIRAQTVDMGVRQVAQEQVGLAFAGWDRLLTRVAVPAWRMGRWPAQLDVGVVAALTELSRRDRLAEGFTARLGERPACDLLETPGEVDRAVSLLAARLFYGAPQSPDPHWQPIDWSAYPEEVVDRSWRAAAARLFAALDTTQSFQEEHGESARSGTGPQEVGRPTLSRILERLTGEEQRAALAARVSAAAVREERGSPASEPGGALVPGGPGEAAPIGLPPAPVKSGREVLSEHITAAVCCAAVDAGGARPGLDWLDGHVLLVDGERRQDLAEPVLALAEQGDPLPLRGWLASAGVRPDKPVRLV
ncbi:hypothetical protein MTQ01_02750 [Streptomyces sp. XM4193]|uniref:hypothetical protein n=1 Tax=Streptomyces sp. XM4193 TaxID=2929782 RepID=UPI001FF73DF4|nr:hypothetical protein [Streptomyces sp. XM4193]MCK1794960.1 hypothetical protein [Streptomyces sp. XM4193]